MNIILGVVGCICLAITLSRGWHPYPLLGRVYRNGENSAMFWFAVLLEIGFVVIGLVALIDRLSN